MKSDKYLYPPKLLTLPEEVLRNILNFLNYDTIANLRLTCHRFNYLCGSVLNIQFKKLRIQVKNYYNLEIEMKRRLPLTNRNQIITFLSDELQKLQSIFGKHIDNKCCCFFAGKILDEAYNIYNIMKMNDYFLDSVGTHKIPYALQIMNAFFILFKKLQQYLDLSNHFKQYF
ncbi:PREDICTED: F-box only protein 28-like [Ceratosolen solmsi marchali]|uniref:F-box only protein 28-like n=1 Tax=Ceratosolen solmsi marchali TaxID=326594 RepID=A0AAJ6VKP5_9HYME|nr:PREDICTED: F-box only protein 28-like [Ceratosolen solmsi marchali]